MVRADKGQLDPRGLAAVVALLIFLVAAVNLTIIDAGVSWLSGLLGGPGTSPVVLYGAAFAISFLVAILGYLGTRIAVFSL